MTTENASSNEPEAAEVSDARLRELIDECARTAAELGAKCAEADAHGKFVARESHGARAAKFADVADAMRELLRLRCRPVAEDARDAARYRWLRAQTAEDAISVERWNAERTSFKRIANRTLDAAIDAARLREGAK
jgi:hypothetical protein